MYFDSHAHYDDPKFDEDREALLKELPLFGIDYVVNAASDMTSSYSGIKLAEKYNYIYAAVGVHPHEVKNMSNQDIDTLKQLSQHEKVVAIGEIGLDFYYDLSQRDDQRFWFQKQLDLAKELNMPVIIHSRDAAQETFDIIKNSGVRNGIIHCYSGSPQMAKDYVDMGFLIGVGGVITFSNAKKLVDTVKEVSIDNIVIETDCPYLAPVPNRGKRNDSRNLKFVVDKIAEVLEISQNDVLNVTKNNAKKIFFK